MLKKLREIVAHAPLTVIPVSKAFQVQYRGRCGRDTLVAREFSPHCFGAQGGIPVPLRRASTKIRFKISPPDDYLSAIGIVFGTYDRSNSCSVIFQLFDDTNRVIRTSRLQGADICNNRCNFFEFEPVPNSKDKQFTVVLSSHDAKRGDYVAVWHSPVAEDGAEPETCCDLRDVITLKRQPEYPDALFIPSFAGECPVPDGSVHEFGWSARQGDYQAADLTENSTFYLPFIATADNFSAISLVFGTYERINRCQIEITLKQLTNAAYATVKHWSVDAAFLKNNEKLRLSFPTIKSSANAEFVLEIQSPDASAEYHLAIWGSLIRKESQTYRYLSFKKPRPAQQRVDYTRRIGLPHTMHQGGLAREAPAQFPELLAGEPNFATLQALIVVPSWSETFASSENLLTRLCSALREQGVHFEVRVWDEALASSLELFPHLAFIFPISFDDSVRAFITKLRLHHVLTFAMQPIERDRMRRKFLELTTPGALEAKNIERLLALCDKTLHACDAVITSKIALTPDEIVSYQLYQFTPDLSFLKGAIAQHRAQRLPKVSIIGILYRKEQEVPHFLQSLFAQSYQGPIEMIFVDDASPDNSVEAVRSYVAKDAPKNGAIEIRIINNPRNCGNCYSRNAAIAQATGEIIAIVDVDCLLSPDFVLAHVARHTFDECNVVIGPFNLETVDRDPQEVLQGYQGNLELVERDSELQDKINKRSFLNCITRNFSVRRTFIDGPLFDEAFSYSADPDSGFGWEDVEMGYRLYCKGAHIGYTAHAFTVHISHPASVDERTKPLRSLKNFRRLIDKHPEFPLVGRRWFSETSERLFEWARKNELSPNDDWTQVERAQKQHLIGPLIKTEPRKLKILSYRWHCPHQYELYKLGHEFTLLCDLDTGFTRGWNFEERPFPANAKFRRRDQVRLDEFDLAIVHFDENCLAPENSNGVLGNDWGKNFTWCVENLKIPLIALCHGTPQFAGQYNPEYTGSDLGQVLEQEREKLVRYLSSITVVVNSHQAEREWQFKKSKVIWQGFDPTEFPLARYQRGIVALGRSMQERPLYRGYDIFRAVREQLPPEIPIEALKVEAPLLFEHTSNRYAQLKFRRYIDSVRDFSVYFNSTRRSPMPRARGEAMMCGLATVSYRNHDVEMFIKNGVNGFFSEDPAELASYLRELATRPEYARSIGKAGRLTALDLFNHDRYLASWRELIQATT